MSNCFELTLIKKCIRRRIHFLRSGVWGTPQHATFPQERSSVLDHLRWAGTLARLANNGCVTDLLYTDINGGEKMTYLALNMKHYKAGQCNAVLAEANHIASRDNVDKKLTSLNYDAITGKEPINYKIARKKLEEIAENNGMTWDKDNGRIVITKADGKRVRRDCNVMTGVVITLDRDTCKAWGQDKVRAYFKACAEYLADKMPCCQAVVHCDEPNAGLHLHFYGSSVVDGNYNAKKMWRRGDLVKLHTDMTAYLQSKGFTDIKRGESGKCYNKTVAELKRDDARTAQDLNKLTATIEEEEPTMLGKLVGHKTRLVMPLNAGKSLLRVLAHVRDKIDARTEINRLQRKLERVSAKLEETQSTISMINSYDNTIIAKAEREYLHRQAMAEEERKKELRQAQQAQADEEFKKRMLSEIKNAVIYDRKHGLNTNTHSKGVKAKKSREKSNYNGR